MWVSRDIVFNETVSWYHPPTKPTPVDAIQNSEDDASEAGIIMEEDIDTHGESNFIQAEWADGRAEPREPTN